MPLPEADLEVENPTTASGRPTSAPRASAPPASAQRTSAPQMREQQIIGPKTILVSRADGSESAEWTSYAQADTVLREFLMTADKADRLTFHVVVVFGDLFLWRSSLSLSRADATQEHFVQR